MVSKVQSRGDEVLTLCSGVVELPLSAIDEIFGIGKLLANVGILVVEFPVFITIDVSLVTIIRKELRTSA